MQVTCPQCSKLLEAPFPLPNLAQCPFCGGVFTPSPAAQSPPPLPAALAPSPYSPPGVPTVPVSAAAGRVSGPAIALLIAGVLWTGFATLNWVGSFAQNNAQPPPMFQQNPEFKRHFEAGMKAAPLIGWFFIVMGLLIIAGAVQMLRRRAYPLALTGTIIAMLPCSPCCVLGLPFGIWSLVVLLDPEVKKLFE